MPQSSMTAEPKQTSLQSLFLLACDEKKKKNHPTHQNSLIHIFYFLDQTNELGIFYVFSSVASSADTTIVDYCTTIAHVVTVDCIVGSRCPCKRCGVCAHSTWVMFGWTIAYTHAVSCTGWVDTCRGILFVFVKEYRIYSCQERRESGGGEESFHTGFASNANATAIHDGGSVAN